MENAADLYKVLKVSHTASRYEIRKAYHRLAKTCHPDKSPESPSEACSRFHRIKRAYTVLSDEAQRRRYDSSLSSSEGLAEQINDLLEYIKNKPRTSWTTQLGARCSSPPEDRHRSPSPYDEEKAFEWLYDQEPQHSSRN